MIGTIKEHNARSTAVDDMFGTVVAAGVRVEQKIYSSFLVNTRNMDSHSRYLLFTFTVAPYARTAHTTRRTTHGSSFNFCSPAHVK